MSSPVPLCKCSNCDAHNNVREYLYNTLFPVLGFNLYLLCRDCIKCIPETRKIGKYSVSDDTLKKVKLVRDIVVAHEEATVLKTHDRLCQNCNAELTFRMGTNVSSAFTGKLGIHSISDICYLCALRSINYRK